MGKFLSSLLPFLLIVGAGCSRTSPVDTDKLADAYVQVILLQEQYRRSDSTATPQQHEQRIKETLASFQLTPEEFRTQFESVSQFQETLSRFYERVNKKLVEKRR
ncbi:MAG: hypothetical protein WBD36_16500 [Bacteroidota bacterium]